MKIISYFAALMLACAALIDSPAYAGDIKNAQHLLGGVLTRAGVRGQTELSDSQLKALCEDGYAHAYFLYSGARARTISCSSGTISYSSINWLKTTPILEAISDGLEGRGRVFVHCHNGAHASGYVAAAALRQFCGYSSSQAMSYWEKSNDYGIPPGYKKIKSNLQSFDPIGGLSNNANCP